MVLGTGCWSGWSGGISCNSSAAYSLFWNGSSRKITKRRDVTFDFFFFVDRLVGYDGNSLWRPSSFGVDRGAHGEDSNRKESCFGICTNFSHTSLTLTRSKLCPLCSKANSTFYDYAARLARQKAHQRIIAQRIMSCFAFVHFIAIG
jgi:hypothetical protein